jgi:hypothetical protein
MHTCSSKSLGLSASDDEVPTHENVHWTIDEETFLIRFLSERTLAGDTISSSDNMYKDSVFKEVADALAPHCKKGAAKSMASCKSKWGRVCISFVRISPVS